MCAIALPWTPRTSPTTAVADGPGSAGPLLDQHIPEVVEDLPGRVENLDRVVSDLSDTLNGVLGAIPGVRRSVRSS